MRDVCHHRLFDGQPMAQFDGPNAQKERHEKNRQQQSDQRRSNENKLTGLPVNPQSTEQTSAQQQSRQDDKVQQRSISIRVVLHFRSRKTFNGLRSFQLRSMPWSNSVFNSAAECICRFGSSTFKIPLGARLMARLTASSPCLKSASSLYTRPQPSR